MAHNQARLHSFSENEGKVTGSDIDRVRNDLLSQTTADNCVSGGERRRIKMSPELNANEDIIVNIIVANSSHKMRASAR